MSEKGFTRKTKGDLPVLAICYDFDKTLSPDDMQAQGFIQAVGYENPKDFWSKTNAIAADNDMDQNLSWMYHMMTLSEGVAVFNRKTLADYGAKVQLFPGVETWFDRINEFGRANNVIVEHYIISSGLKEMIEGTSIAQKGVFEKIYASSFYFNERGVAKWPAQVVNYTNKTQFLFRIQKGVLDVNDMGVNDSFAAEDIRVPFRNMVYIGDSDTDVPCMRLVNSFGGHSIGVYDPKAGAKEKVYKMLEQQRIKYFVPADYTENSDLESLLKGIILKTAETEKLEELFYRCKKEVKDSKQQLHQRLEERHEQDIQKQSLITSLLNSQSFAMTHTIIRQLAPVPKWSDAQKEELCRAIENPQVGYIFTDDDVIEFYRKLILNTSADTEFIKAVREKLEGIDAQETFF